VGAVFISCHVPNTEVPMGRLWHLKVNPATVWTFKLRHYPITTGLAGRDERWKRAERRIGEIMEEERRSGALAKGTRGQCVASMPQRLKGLLIAPSGARRNQRSALGMRTDPWCPPRRKQKRAGCGLSAVIGSGHTPTRPTEGDG
jgi:hypothetical protein